MPQDWADFVSGFTSQPSGHDDCTFPEHGMAYLVSFDLLATRRFCGGVDRIGHRDVHGRQAPLGEQAQADLAHFEAANR